MKTTAMVGELTKREKQMLLEVRQSRRYPIARFELHSSRSEELVSTALDYVRIVEEDDSMELVKERGEALRSLEEKGLLRADYDINVWVCGDHTIYYRSALYALLCRTAMEAQSLPGCVFDVPAIRKGYVRLTARGRKAVCV